MTGLLRTCLVALVAGVGLAIAGLVPAARAEDAKTVVFAAASLKTALDQINAKWEKETGKRASISYAASPVLAKQIEQDAPADLFISADSDWMDYLAARGLIKTGSRANLVGNRLLLIAGRDGPGAIKLEQGFDLGAALGGGRLAIADVASVPAGKYGKAALETLGAWAGVVDHLAQTENVRAALMLVARGEAPLGVVYRSDAAAEASVRIVATFPEDSHPRILYPAALTAKSGNGEAAEFLEYLKSEAARRVFEAQGFTVLR